VISTTADSAQDVFAADLDGDGDRDVLSASWNDSKVAWYDNDGSQHFTERVLTRSASGAKSVSAADLDADGDLDVLYASLVDDTVAWFQGQNVPATVAGRQLFYNRSSFDGADSGANANDDQAIANDKAALLPGALATMANFSSYSRGSTGSWWIFPIWPNPHPWMRRTSSSAWAIRTRPPTGRWGRRRPASRSGRIHRLRASHA